jgi:hypothetical protein
MGQKQAFNGKLRSKMNSTDRLFRFQGGKMLKKVAFLAVVILLTAGVVYAKGYSAVKKAGIYHVTLKMGKDPVPVGENKAVIEIEDSTGAYVTGANVELHYFMPSMPAMSYRSKAEPNGNLYSVVIKPTMPGHWKVDVKITDGKGKLCEAVFEFKVK